MKIDTGKLAVYSTITLIVLKLANVANISWWAVFSPILIVSAFWIPILLLLGIALWWADVANKG